MHVSQVFTEGGYYFPCTVLEDEESAFSCAIEFTSVEHGILANLGSVEMHAHFGSAIGALRAAHHYGRPFNLSAQ